MNLEQVIQTVKEKNPAEPEFHQAVEEVLESVWPVVEARRDLVDAKIIERIVIPERTIAFRIEWKSDAGEVMVNRGWRTQFSSVLGPYKGGLRFHPSVTLSILKFLGFEQIFKNSLTGLPLGGGKGGSDFDPKGKSDTEVERFCRVFMDNLYPYIGATIDVPAGDIGVGGREIAFMFDEYKRLGGKEPGVLTGKSIKDGGSELRTEATGYGLVYLTEEILSTNGNSVAGRTAVVSGSGNVAQYTVEKLNQLGAKVLTMSDSDGTIYDKEGISAEKLAHILEIKNVARGRIKEYLGKYPEAEYLEGQAPWSIPADMVFPCATQNEISLADAEKIIANKTLGVFEGANMPTVKEGTELFLSKKILYAPSKAANAGGVAVSGLEMEQNRKAEHWKREEVDERLRLIMKNIHQVCVEHGTEASGFVNYVRGANIAGFLRVAGAMSKKDFS